MNRMRRRTWRWVSWCFLVTLLSLQVVEGQTFTQEIRLRPGWNAVHLEVEPADRSMAAVLDGLPVASVWTRVERVSAAGFVRNQNEVAWNEPGWLVYLPASHPDAYLTTLRAVTVNHPYLIQLQGTEPVVWRVTGRPSLRHPAWVPDALNLRGFPVDPERPATFGAFLGNAPAHARSDGTLEEIYRLETDGRWRRVEASERMVSGEALWVFSRGASEFVAPLAVSADLGDGLDFDLLIDQLSLRLQNASSLSRTLSVVTSGSVTPPRWTYRDEDFARGRVAWTPLPSSLGLPVAARGAAVLRLAPRRQQLPTEHHGEVLRVIDGAGTRHLVPVTARRGAGDGLASSGVIPAGLWMGTVRVTAVAEVHGASPEQPTPVKAGFPLRLLLHVDGEGRARLLKEVIQMWEDGTYRDVGGVREVARPGRVVWLTDPRLVARYQGVTLRDGVPVGRRLTSVGFDFDGGPEQVLSLAGSAVVGGKLTGTLEIGSGFPTNPFRHRYHPDHDNLDERFTTFRAEAYAVSRALEFEFSAEDPTGFTSPDYGQGVVGGVFRETLTGLHHRPVRLRGEFRLQRLSDDPELNPAPRVD